MKCFAFASRSMELKFFDENPVIVTLPIGGAMDQKIDTAMQLIIASDKKDTEDKKVETGKKVLADLIGTGAMDEILARSEVVDSYAIQQVVFFVRTAYVDEKAKNLSASLVK